MAISKERLLSRTLGQERVDLGDGDYVIVQGITRGQYLEAGKVMTEENPNISLFEGKLIVAGMVDPILDEAEVAQWQATAGANEIARVVEAIQRLSGGREGAHKSGLQGLRG